MAIRGKKISMVMQDPMTSLNPLKKIGKQIEESITYNQGIKGEEARKMAIEMLSKVGIPDPERRAKQYPHEFSGGMRQRVVIAIAAACRPDILICDEPTTALDVTIQAQILDLIRGLQKDLDMTVIYITHDLGVVANVADRVAVMYAGQIVEVGTVEEIFYDAWHPYTWALLNSLPQLGVKGEELPTIEGTPPNLFNEVHGDAFAPRNKQALAIDFEEEPPFFNVSETHIAKTWYLDPRAPKIEQPKSILSLRNKMKKLGGKMRWQREKNSLNSKTCRLPSAPAVRSSWLSITSISTSTRGRRSPWWVSPVPERPPSAAPSPGSTRCPPGRSTSRDSASAGRSPRRWTWR